MPALTVKRFGAAALASLALASGGALACQCKPLPLSIRIVGADVIIVGRVSEVEPLQRVTVQPVEILKGLGANDMVVTDGQIKLRDGAPVVVMGAPPPAAPGAPPSGTAVPAKS